MKKKVSLSLDHKNLIRRYLLWAYKSTKEGFERIERKSTQLLVDEYILDYFSKNKFKMPQEFKVYVADKRRDELKLKFVNDAGKDFHPDYVYLKNRLKVIEAAIICFLGRKELVCMQRLYEAEFTRRILEARDH